MISEDEDVSPEESQIIYSKKKNSPLDSSEDVVESDLSRDSEAHSTNKTSDNEISKIQQSNSGIISKSLLNDTHNESLKTSTPSKKIKKRGRSYFADKYNDSNKSSSDVILLEGTNSSNEKHVLTERGNAINMNGKSFSTPQQAKDPQPLDSDEGSKIVFSKKKTTKILESDEDEASFQSFSSGNDSKLNQSSKKSFITPRKIKHFSSSDSDEASDKMLRPNTKNNPIRPPKKFSQPDQKQQTEDLPHSDSDEESIIVQSKKKPMKIIESDDDEASNNSFSVQNDEGVPRSSRKSFITPRKINTFSSSDSDEASESFVISDDDSDVIEASITDESLTMSTIKTPKPAQKKLNQPTLEGIVKKMTLNNDENTLDGKIMCKRTDYKRQIELIQKYEQDMGKTKNLLTTIKLANLPDKGKMLRERFEAFKKNFLDAQEKLKNMVVTEEDLPQPPVTGRAALTENWNNLEAGMAVVQPKTFGKKGLQQHNIQRALTADCLEQLHGSLKNCPNDENLEDDPAGLKIPLMHHQKRALKWLLYREKQKPSGGILADDMGLGKTLTMISLIVKALHQDEPNDELESMSRNMYRGGTLVVCPASLLHQWGQEIETKLKRGTLSYYIYHGPKRESKPKRLAENDVVITTYSIAMNESEKNGAIFRIRWKRIILDEAHQIRNHKAQTSIACCSLSGVSRWALTGTPVHNKELDMYALLKFLRCSPFDDLAVWKRWVGDKGSGGGERLHTVISSLMLRRTKTELIQQGKLGSLPSKEWQLKLVALDESEMNLYHRVLIFSQKLFAQFLKQRDEKNYGYTVDSQKGSVNEEYLKMRQKLFKMNRLKEVSQHEILVLLLRLRQICCHPTLIIGMLQGDEDLGDEEPEAKVELNLLEQLEKLDLEDCEPDDVPNNGLNFGSDAGVAFKEAARNILSPSHPIFDRDRMSSKIKAVMDLVPNILAAGDKIVMVSQWRSYLELVGIHLKASGIKFLQFDGSVVTAKRNEITTAFNDVNSKVKVLLLSLTAGGVGLNLIGGNHLFLLDLHWNPQLESQAQDRIYRMGQKKNVHVYKFMTSDTIEERIQKLQENKLAIAENMISGTKQVIANKLSL